MVVAFFMLIDGAKIWQLVLKLILAEQLGVFLPIPIAGVIVSLLDVEEAQGD